MSDAPRKRLSTRARIIAVIVGIFAAVVLLVMLNWMKLTTTVAPIYRAHVTYDTELTVFFWGCSYPSSIHVDESPDRVEILVVLDAPRFTDCHDDAAYRVVTLDEPLRDRTVVDRSTGKAIDVGTVVVDPE
jgi:hypothetical protein